MSWMERGMCVCMFVRVCMYVCVWDLDSRQLYRVLNGARYVCMCVCMWIRVYACI